MVRRKGEARGVVRRKGGGRRGCGWEEGRGGSLSGVVCASLCCSAVCVCGSCQCSATNTATLVTNGSNYWILRQPDQVSKTETWPEGVLFATTSVIASPFIQVTSVGQTRELQVSACLLRRCSVRLAC